MILPQFKFIDLFAGIGGFHVALHELGGECVMACEKDKSARQAYHENFKSVSPDIFTSNMFVSDIHDLTGELLEKVPEFDILCAGFPCQPFSNAGHRLGFSDVNRGNLFFDIIRIMKTKRPTAYILENVRNLITHDNGATLRRIRDEIKALGYSFSYQLMKASDYGLPQHRPRVFMVGFDQEKHGISNFQFPDAIPLKMNMNDIWDSHQCDKDIGYTLRVGGRGSPYGDRHNWDGYMVDGIMRRLGPVEGRRMMGFKPDHVLSTSTSQAMKQLGNSVAIPIVRAVGREVIGIDSFLKII